VNPGLKAWDFCSWRGLRLHTSAKPFLKYPALNGWVSAGGRIKNQNTQVRRQTRAKMPLKVIAPEGNTFSIHSPQDFEKIFKVGYLSSVRFGGCKTQDKIEKRCKMAFQKEWITLRQKWLGHYYAQAIRGRVHLDLTIAWIDEKIGFGVWTNVDIPAQAYIGEYTGVVRKRIFFGRWKNRYCFDYNIGEGRRSSYVIDAQDFGNYTRFINHSFEPNLEPVSVYCDGLVHIIVYAPKAIPAGTQLCYDYGDDYWQKRGKPSALSKFMGLRFSQDARRNE
jgi:uncharacterized protein